MKRLRFGLALALGVAALLAPARRADAVVVERIVAVVGERPILYSELRHRAKPNLLHLIVEGRDQNYQSAARSEIYKVVMEQMINDRLVEQVAERAHINVLPEDVDRGIQNVANNAQLPVGALVAEVRHQGMSEQDFRDEIRRQILMGKLIELRVRPRVRVTEQDARAAYQHWRDKIIQDQPVELKLLAMRVPVGATDDQVLARQRLAEDVVRRARGGQDFCELVKKYSEDTETRDICGDRGATAKAKLFPQFQEALATMKAGDVSDPIRMRGPNDAIVIFQLGNDFKVPPYEQVKDRMTQQAVNDAVERQTRLWLEELKRGVYIDVRL